VEMSGLVDRDIFCLVDITVLINKTYDLPNYDWSVVRLPTVRTTEIGPTLPHHQSLTSDFTPGLEIGNLSASRHRRSIIFLFFFNGGRC
jgi:hypothetical protein